MNFLKGKNLHGSSENPKTSYNSNRHGSANNPLSKSASSLNLNRSMNPGGNESTNGDDVDSIDDDDDVNYDDDYQNADLNNNDEFRIYDQTNNFATSKSLKSASVWNCDWHLHNIPQVHIKYLLFINLKLF